MFQAKQADAEEGLLGRGVVRADEAYFEWRWVFFQETGAFLQAKQACFKRRRRALCGLVAIQGKDKSVRCVRRVSSRGGVLFQAMDACSKPTEGGVLQPGEHASYLHVSKVHAIDDARQDTPLLILNDTYRCRTCTRRRIIMVAHDSVGSTPCARMSANCSSASSSIPSDASSCTSRLHIGHGGYAPRLRMRLKYSSASCLQRIKWRQARPTAMFVISEDVDIQG